jgi:hypothetical protein
MSDLDSVFQRSLDRLVPSAGLEPDWDDVLDRAAAVPLPRNRRAWYALAAAVMLTAILVNPAFGLGDRLLDFFVGEPAPEPVKRGLAEMNQVNRGVVIDLLREQGPGILAEQARGLMQVTTPVGPLRVWAAPTQTGGLCVSYVVGPAGTISCNRPAQRVPFSPDVSTVPVRGKRVVVVTGWAKEPIASIELRLADGSSRPVRMAKRFYLAVLPLEPRVTHAIGSTASGKESARVPISAFLYETAPPEPEPEPLPAGPPARTIIELETAEGLITLSAPPDQKGVRCWNLDANGTETGTCAEGRRPVVVQVDQAGSGERALVLVHGVVGPKVRSLELSYEDGAGEPIRLVAGFFLFDVPRDRWSAGRQPAVLVARDAAGRVIAREPVVRKDERRV